MSLLMRLSHAQFHELHRSPWALARKMLDLLGILLYGLRNLNWEGVDLGAVTTIARRF